MVLFTPIWPAVRHQAARSAAIVMVVIVTLHILLAVGFMLYFFHVPSGSGGGVPHNATETVPASNDNVNDTADNGQKEEKKALEAEKKVQAQIHTNETGVKDSGGEPNTNDKEVTKREDEAQKEQDVSKDNSSEANKVQDNKDQIDTSKGDKQESVSESENNVSEKKTN